MLMRLIVLVLVLAGCSKKEPDNTYAVEQKTTEATVHNPKPAQTKAGQVKYALSAKSQQAKILLDQKAFEAAGKYFWENLGVSNDAGLHCQYVRYLIIASEPAEAGFIQSPIGSDHESRFWATGVASDAADLSAQLDPKCKTYLANIILESLAQRIDQSLNEGYGCIGLSRPLYYPKLGQILIASGSQLSMIQLGWKAIEFDSAQAQQWAPRFNTLLDRSVNMGKVSTAMYLGNLTGDLRQQGKGAEDFKIANRAFYAALDKYEADGEYNWLEITVESYPECFRDEMLEMNQGHEVDPLFSKLEQRLKAYGVVIPRPSKETFKERMMPTGGSMPNGTP